MNQKRLEEIKQRYWVEAENGDARTACTLVGCSDTLFNSAMGATDHSKLTAGQKRVLISIEMVLDNKKELKEAARKKFASC